jgi:acyl dehydratase
MSPQELSTYLGKEIGVSGWFVVDQQRIDTFARCTEDFQWIHTDVARAASDSPFGATVAHGFLSLSLLSPTATEVLLSRVQVKHAVNYGLEKVRFLAPVRAGKHVRNRIKIAALETKEDGRVLVTTENTLEIEGEEKPALIALALILMSP